MISTTGASMLLERYRWHVAVLIGCSVVGAFWWQRAETRRLRGELTAVAREHPRPVLLNGLALDLSRHLDRPVTPATGTATYLVIVVSDVCPYSQQQQQRHIELVRRISFRPADHVVVISTSGTRLRDELVGVIAKRGVGHTATVVTDPTRFAQATGLAWTPEILVLDAGMRIRAATRTLDGAMLEAFGSIFQAGS